jgi:dTDP-4-dehydrorhamnose 3,5-epimerase
MKFTPTKFQGVFIIDLEPNEDSRGFFARTFCIREFENHGLVATFVQCSLSLTRKQGALRGLHYQRPPSTEVKLVRCTAGALYDVIVDLRPESATLHQHLGIELTAKNRRAVYVPGLFAHGFQTLESDTEVFYQISEYYTPEASTGVRYNDPRLGIRWPLPVTELSERDANLPLLG